MSYNQVVAKTWDQNRLFSALLELTYRCNWDCYFCYNDLSLKGRALSKVQYFELLDDLHRLGTLHVILTGGEPMTHPDFFELGARARELGFVVRVKSNGHLLHEHNARRLREEVDPFVVEVSLHGASAEVHERQTRVEGSFQRLVDNIAAMRSVGLRVHVHSTLTAWNEGEMEEMFTLARELEVPLQFDPEVTPRDNGDLEPLSIRPSQRAVLRLFEFQRQMQEELGEEVLSIQREGDALPGAVESEKHCGAGSATIAVDPYGNVYPCVQWRQSVGNLHETTLSDLWRGSEVLDEVREQNVAAKGVVDARGEDGASMGFCPGLARLREGDPGEVYATAAANGRARRQVATGQAALRVLR